MLRAAIAALALIAAPAALAGEPEWRTASEYDVLLGPWEYQPEEIRLEAGKPVRLRFVNEGRTTHSFNAPAFFAAAQVHRSDAGAVADGRIRLGPGERRTVALVPAPGRYRARSANLFHRLMGMSARIVVE